MESVALLALRIGFGFVTAFLSIIVWSKTREAAWLVLVLAIMLDYLGVLFEALVMVGLLSWGVGPSGLSLFTLLFKVLPYLLFAGSFILFLIHKRQF